MVVHAAKWGLLLACLGLACTSRQEPASAADVVMPDWVDEQPGARPEPRVLAEHENTSHAGRQANPKDREHRESRERQEVPPKSTLLDKSHDSKFFGGCGKTDGTVHNDCNR
jgi:hypothetical protein